MKILNITLLSMMSLILVAPVRAEEAQNKNTSKSVESFRLTDAEVEALEKGKISDGQTLGGIALGLGLGFGLGQAAIGKYKNYGWVFTLIDTAIVGTIAGGAVMMALHKPDPNKFLDTGPGLALVALGTLSLAGSHVTQVIAVGVSSGRHNSNFESAEEKVSKKKAVSFDASPIIQQNGGGLSVGLRF